jgi:TldD protein
LTALDLAKVVDFAQGLGSEFADVRLERHRMQRISVINGDVRNFTSFTRSGAAVRVKLKSAWGLAATSVLTPDSLRNAAKKAYKLAKTASVYSEHKIEIPEAKPVKKSLTAKVKLNPEDVNIEEKLKFVFALDKGQKEADKRIKSRTSDYLERSQKIKLANSLGSELSWEELRTSFSALSIALEGGRREFGRNAKSGTLGYELVHETDPFKFAGEVGKEAVEMLSAVKPPNGLMDVVVDPDIAGVLAHEVMGHASEADEVIKKRSFLQEAVGKTIGSKLVTMVDDGTIAKANGSIPYDSEGTPSSRTTIIKDGIYTGFMHSIETAAALGSKPTGNGRAQDYNRRVWVRMTNTFFEPGDHKLEEIISNIKNGLLALKAISGMEDPVGGGFQVRAQKGYTIKNGQKDKLVRSFTLTGKAIDILRTVDMVSRDFRLWSGTCGKGEEDYVPVTSGGPYMKAKILVGGG